MSCLDSPITEAKHRLNFHRQVIARQTIEGVPWSRDVTIGSLFWRRRPDIPARRGPPAHHAKLAWRHPALQLEACRDRRLDRFLRPSRTETGGYYRLSQAAITTHPSGNAVILAGVNPAVYGLSGGAGCLGPGHRGNACVGRAVSLTVLHLSGARPGEADLTMFGSGSVVRHCLLVARPNPT
jgi:hypothetical protein